MKIDQIEHNILIASIQKINWRQRLNVENIVIVDKNCDYWIASATKKWKNE